MIDNQFEIFFENLYVRNELGFEIDSGIEISEFFEFFLIHLQLRKSFLISKYLQIINGIYWEYRRHEVSLIWRTSLNIIWDLISI